MGKRTTTRHKEDNTFRFQSFEEKLRQISVNVNLSIRDGRGDNPEEDGTYFSQEIEKWVELNRTESFASLLCNIGVDSRTLAQVLLQKDRLAAVLLEHLQNIENVASFEPSLALVVALSRDLGDEFYPHFEAFFKTIIKIVMESKSTNIIEAGFKCYAYLTKYLRKQIIKDLHHHMKLFSPFLDPKLKTYVMIFACEAFSIVAGKFARDHSDKFLKLILSVFLRKHPEHAVGVATLLFSIFKGVGNTLKLEGPGLYFKNCVTFLHDLENSEETTVWTEVLSHLTKRLLQYGIASDSQKLMQIVENTLIEDLKGDRDVSKLLSVYCAMVEFNNCGKLTNVESCATVLYAISKQCSNGTAEVLTKTIVSIIESKCQPLDTETLTILQPVITSLLNDVSFELLEPLDACLRKFRAYFRLFLEPIIAAYNRLEKPKHIEECSDISVYCLSEAIVNQGSLYQLPNSEEHYFSGNNTPMYNFQTQKRIVNVLNASSLKGTTWNCCSLMTEAENGIKNGEFEHNSNYYTRLILVFSRLNSKNCEACLQSCTQIFISILNQDQLNPKAVPAIFYLLQVFITQIPLSESVMDLLPINELLLKLKPSLSASSESFYPWSLKVLDVIIYFIKATKFVRHQQEIKTFIEEEWESLTSNLQSGYRMIRALTVSSILNALNVIGGASEKTVEMLDKFVQIENMCLTNSKFVSLAKAVLTECKVIIGSDTYEVKLKLLCLKYALGIMYTNFSLIWGPCVEVIRHAGKHIDMASYWKVFGAHFCKSQGCAIETSEDAPLKMFSCSEDETSISNFLELITADALGLPKTAAGYAGQQEQLDMTQYKVNLWLSLREQPLTRKEYADIKQFIEAIIDGSNLTNVEENNLTRRERSKMIIPVLQFLESCDLVNVNHELWESALKYLTYSQDVQKAAWKFLFAKRKNKLKNYKEDIDEILNSESMDPVHKFRIDAVDVSLNKQYENETIERRTLLMDIIIRILIGKERVMKGDKRTQVLRFLAGCTEADARKYLDLTVGSADEVQKLSPKIIEIKINKMTSALRTWRYKFPDILDQMVHGVCDLVCAVDSSVKPLSRKSMDPEEEIPEEVFEEQKRAALKAGRLCMVAFFTSLPRLDMKQETLDRIFNVFIWPALHDITTTSVGSVSWILKLFLVWSTYERYHVLLTKCNEGDVCQSPMWRLFDLLDSKSAVFEVKKYILGIVLNLSNPPEVPEEDSDEPVERYLNCSNSPLSVSGTHQFETSESIGLNIILLRKEVILNLFQDAQVFKKFTSQSGGGGCLALISLLAGFTSDGLLNEKLCSIIIDTFGMHRNNEENLFNSIVAVGKLLCNIHDPLALLMKLVTNFSWISGRRLRTALVETLVCKKETPLYEVVCGMNEWAELAADTPNFSKRQESFEKAEKLIKDEKYDILSWSAIFYNCFYNINHEEDIGMRNGAQNLLLLMSSTLHSKLADDPNIKADVHRLLDSVILPKLRRGVQQKEDKRYEDLLRVLHAFISSCHNLHGTFKELSKVLSEDIIEGFCDIQVHLRTRAMNKLCKKLKDAEETVSPAVLQAFILPIASHNLFDEERLSKNFNELIDSSIEVLKAVMEATSHDQYFSYLNKLLDDPKKNSKLAKQFERVLIAIMDAFHFDLKLACPEDNRNEERSIGQQNVETSKDVAIVNPEDDKDSNDDEKEEFTIPKAAASTSVQVITLVPQAAAVRCLGILKSSIIPKLRKFLHFEETATHKLSRAKKTVDDDVILKIPCTIALVKLLKKIPKAEGQNGIRSIIPSIAAGLRNELVSVRNTLRKTLLSVIKELGTSHLKAVIGYLKSSLQRGYQKHVLNYTVAYLLRCLESELKANPHHVPVKEIMSLCEDELYGVMQEEKELAAIKQKTREASKSNACPILKVCSKCVSGLQQLNSLIEPALKHISERKSLKVAKASRQWLSSVSEGLSDNTTVNYYELLNWLLEVIKKDESQEELDKSSNDGQPPNKKPKLLETIKDSRLIPSAKRKTVLEGKVGSHLLLTEFALTALYTGLNRNGKFRENVSSNESLSLLDCFVPHLVDGIKAPSKQVNVVSLRVVTLLLELELSNFKKPDVIDALQRHGFIAMNNHCYRNTTDSDITNATFKFLGAFFIRFSDFKIVLQDFELMLKCIQSYLTDGNCSSSALTLLKGVLQNKYRCSALPDLMQEVFKQCITSYYQHINEGCRQAYLAYLNNYLTNPKDLDVEVQLILRQLDYEHDSGRVTAAEILNSLLQSIPEDCFEEVKELIFLKLLATMDKEKAPKVRERLGDVLKSLFKLEKRKSLTRLLLKLLMMDKHVPELDTFFLIIGLVIDDTKVFSQEDLAVIIDRVKDVLDPFSLSKLCSGNNRVTQQIKDYMIFQAVVLLKKAMGRSGDMPLWSKNSPLSDKMEIIFDLLRDVYLLYEHEWVPLIAVDIISISLNKLQLTEEETKNATALSLEKNESVCIFLKNSQDLQELLSKLWTSMRKSDREDVLAKGAYSLVQLISVAARFKTMDIFVDIVSSIRRSVNSEVVKNPGVTTIRTVALGCYRGIVKSCPRDAIVQVVEIMTRVAVRELTDSNVPSDVKNEAEKLITVLRNTVGNSEFNIIHAQVNDFFHKKRNLNRAKKKETVMLHPGLVRKRPKNVKTPFPMKKRKKN